MARAGRGSTWEGVDVAGLRGCMEQVFQWEEVVLDSHNEVWG